MTDGRTQPRGDTANDLQQLAAGIGCGVTWDRHAVPFASKVDAADGCRQQLHVQQLLSEVRETSGAEWERLTTSIAVPGKTMVLLDTCHDVFSRLLRWHDQSGEPHMSWDTDGRTGEAKAAVCGWAGVYVQHTSFVPKFRLEMPPRPSGQHMQQPGRFHSHTSRTRSPLPSPLLRPIPAAGSRG